MKHFSRYLFCALLLLTTWQVTPCQTQPKPPIVPLNSPGEDADFQRYLTSGRISVVTFFADWCPTCRRWAPLLGLTHGSFPDMQVLLMDIGEWDTPVTKKYGIESVPHFKIYDGDGRLIVEGDNADDWLRNAIAQRFEARARSNSRGTTLPKSYLNNATGSVTTRPASGGRARSKASVVALNARDKVDSSGPLPTVDQVLGRYLKEVGATDSPSTFRTGMAKGKVNISKLGRGSFVVYFKSPNKVSTTIEIPDVGVFKQGFDGASGWSQDPRKGLRSASKAELATLRRDADFYCWANLKVRYPQMKVLGISKIGYREAYLIEARTGTSPPERLHFSKENGLLIRWDAVLEDAGTQTPVEAYLDDWTTINGIKMPLTITQVFPHASIVLSFDEVKHDVELNDDVFNRPGTR
ncbi:MAG TPA: thioredoxin family protein [Pyrinomonadaceae bacterium]|nr:thioredoxin family protein [Pyrinomonadaceae bacterium]